MKVITHASNWPLTLGLAFYIIFTWAPVNFTWAQAQVCSGVSVPLLFARKSSLDDINILQTRLFCESLDRAMNEL